MSDQTTKLESSLMDRGSLKINLKMYARFWRYLFNKQGALFLGYGIFLIFMGALTPVFTYLWKVYLDQAMVGESSLAVITLILFMVLRILLDLCYFFSMQFVNYINFSSWRVMDGKINAKALSIKPEYFEIPHLQSRINRAWDFSHGDYVDMYQLGMNLIQQITQLIGIFSALYLVSPLVAFVSLINVVPAFFSKLIKDKVCFEKKRILDDDKNELKYYENSIMNQSTIKDVILNNAFSFFSEKYRKKADAVFRIENRVNIKKMLFSFLESFLMNIVALVCILCAVVQAENGKISIGGIAAIATMVFRLLKVLTDLVCSGAFVFTATCSINQYFEFMDLDMIEAGKNEGVREAPIDKDIMFKDVSYRYPLTDKYVIKNLNLAIKHGQHVAVVGANGSGKSTFVKLLMKLIEPSKGEIMLDGVDLKYIDDQTYWGIFSTVFQDYNKFRDTLRVNVGISSPENMTQDEKIKKALEKAEFHKPITLDEMLTKEFGGMDLSGGEWQKISIARALFKNQDSIYIFDEPTASIDPVAESNLYKMLDQITKGNTSIYVTHRLGSVLYSDLVLFFDKGELVEYGSHEELLAREGAYSEFWKAQCGLYQCEKT